MATAALFVGYGAPHAGREQQALQVFGEAIQFYQRLQQQGEIESFESVFLEPHGGDLDGFILLRGERDKLNRLRYSEDVLRLNNRAGLVVQNFGVVAAFLGEEQSRMFSDYQAQATQLGG